MLAAPDRLATVVQDVARKLPVGKLRGVRVYLAVPPAPAVAIKTTLAPSGAEVVTLDLAMPIPQRSERLRGETPFDDDLEEIDLRCPSNSIDPVARQGGI